MVGQPLSWLCLRARLFIPRGNRPTGRGGYDPGMNEDRLSMVVNLADWLLLQMGRFPSERIAGLPEMTASLGDRSWFTVILTDGTRLRVTVEEKR